MGRSRLDFDPDPFLRKMNAEMRRRLMRSAILVWNHWKALINVDGTGVEYTQSELTKAGKPRKNRKFKLIYGANPSKPGDPPHKQRGRLLASAAWELLGLIARVGTNLGYGRILELGGRNVKARPSLRRALKEKQAEIQDIMSRPMR